MSPLPSVSWPDIERKTTEVLGSIVLTLALLQRLGLRQIVDKHCPYTGALSHGLVFTILVLNRLHSPRPLYRVAEWATDVGLVRLLGINGAALNDDRLAETLEVAYGHQEAIQTDLTLAAVAQFGLAITEIHYDLTSIFFWGRYDESDLVEHGYSRDGKPQQVQVVLGLSVAADGEVPVRSHVHAGNTADGTTQVESFHALARMIGTHDFLLTADSIMQSVANMRAIEQAGGRYLGPISLQGRLAEIVSRLPDGLYQRLPYTDTEVNQRKKQPSIYRGCYIHPVLVVKEPLAPDEQAVAPSQRQRGRPRKTKESVVRPHGSVIWDSQRQVQEEQERGRALQRYEETLASLARWLNHRRYRKRAYAQERLAALAHKHKEVASFVKVHLLGEDEHLTLQVEHDQVALDRAARLDGKWLLVSNEPLGERSKLAYMDWALIRYKKGHRRIEGRMRNLKSDMPIRPLYLHNADRIGGLCFAHIVALTVFSLIERECARQLTDQKLTFMRLAAIWAVFSLTVFHLTSGEQIYWPDNLTARQEHLLTALGLHTAFQTILAQGLSP